MKKHILILFAIFAFSASANAIVELRAGYGVQTPADDEYGGGAAIKTMSGFNLDAILELPMLPFGFGLRYESMGFDVTNTGIGDGTLDSKLKRTSLIVNYRFIDLFTYLGLIGTLGFANELSVWNFQYDADLTYSIGVEGGLSLGLFMVGAEFGYSLGTYKDKNNLNTNMDLDGVYAKAIVGVGF